MPYTLITVTYGGEVHHSRGYETLLMCREARSVALTGMTIAEAEESEREEKRRVGEIAAARTELFAAWQAKMFPPRAATPQERDRLRLGTLSWAADAPAASGNREFDGGVACYTVRRSKLGDDGLIHDVIGWRWLTWSGPLHPYPPPVPKGKDDIKSARCVLEAPDAPSEPVAA